jgi:murein L,D-transpeptidase YcbB/YkuD
LRHLLRFQICLLIAMFSLASCATAEVPYSHGITVDIAAETIHHGEEVAAFYELTERQVVWTGAANAENLNQLISAVRMAESHGLSPEHYHLWILKRAQGGGADLFVDWFITDVYFTLAAHLAHGKLDPNNIESTWNFRPAGFDAPTYLHAALGGSRVEQSLMDLAPQHEEYQRLREGLNLYRWIEGEGGWPTISAGPTLHPGDRSPRVADLRARLEATGDLPQVGEEHRDLFEPDLEIAVSRFQTRSGLNADGVVGAVTLAHLNRGARDRIDQLRITLERWRWLPRDLGDRHLRVNIAGFQLEAWEDGERAQVHDVIVGRTYRQTPVFSADMRYLILNPWWETPPSLAVQDKLPLFRRDPEVIQRLGYEIRDRQDQIVDSGGIDWNLVSASSFPYRVRQRPGPENALGRIKFMFPNVHNVYIHDTPAQQLFESGQRDFSSGCIRVAQPLVLADWVLENREEWLPEPLRAAVETGTETRIDLNSPIPVHILYFTVVVDEDVGFRFLNDIYERDAAVLAELNVPPGYDEGVE